MYSIYYLRVNRLRSARTTLSSLDSGPFLSPAISLNARPPIALVLHESRYSTHRDNPQICRLRVPQRRQCVYSVCITKAVQAVDYTLSCRVGFVKTQKPLLYTPYSGCMVMVCAVCESCETPLHSAFYKPYYVFPSSQAIQQNIK